MDGALRRLAGAEPAPPAPSDSDSDDDPASHASFHRFARPAARAAEARTGAGWYALSANEDAAAAGEEEVEGGSAFVDGATDDASGLRRGNVAALVEARVAVWDDAAASGGAVAVCLAACLLWARDHFLALPVLLCVCGLGALGLQRLEGDWARRRLGEAGDRGPRTRGDVAVLRVALLGVDGLEPYAGGDARPRVRLKYVPAPTLRAVARGRRGDAARGVGHGAAVARRAAGGADARRRRTTTATPRRPLAPPSADAAAASGARQRDAAAADDAPAALEPTAADLATVARRRARRASPTRRPTATSVRRRWRCGGAATTAWAVPVLRELRRDAGGGDGARPARVAWARSAGLRVELYARRAARRRVAARDAQQLFARTFRDRASPAYYPHRMAPALSRGAPSAGSLRSLGALLRGEGDGEDDGGDCFACRRRDPDATLLGVAEVPSAPSPPRAATTASGIPRARRLASAAPAATRCCRRRDGAAARDDVSDDDGGYASADGDDAPAAAARAAPVPPGAAGRRGARRVRFGRAGRSRWPATRPRPATTPTRRATATPAPSRARGCCRGSAAHGAVEIQNSLKDAVRLGEQVRGLLEWSQPAFTLLVFGALVLALAVAASAPATAPRRPRPATGPRGGPAPRGVLRARAPAPRAAGALTPRRRGVAAAGQRRRAAPFQPATVWQRLLALLEALPCEPELEQLFSQRRKARDWRRDRRSAARRLGAAWAGPLWRRSTAWRRHFAAVRGPELQFWYSAQHALSGVTPVLVVSLGGARLVDDALASDNLPVLTLHAPLKSKPDVHREWRLAAAHHRDARALQRCICDRADDSRAAAAADAPATPPPDVKKGL
ncbi:vacuolar sorting protein 9 (VPS9) domain containing protein [Aureococcus anophagefferens]|nr:vacuolar sorting protein 9 (VPS9) domain containing protein [Aureococcus anophagefferens]